MHSEYQAETYFFLGKTVSPDASTASPEDSQAASAAIGENDLEEQAARDEAKREAR